MEINFTFFWEKFRCQRFPTLKQKQFKMRSNNVMSAFGAHILRDYCFSNIIVFFGQKKSDDLAFQRMTICEMRSGHLKPNNGNRTLSLLCLNMDCNFYTLII